jgi:hypothetical protein
MPIYPKNMTTGAAQVGVGPAGSVWAGGVGATGGVGGLGGTLINVNHNVTKATQGFGAGSRLQ